MADDKKKVLIIDDDENLRTVLSDKLSVAGFSPLQAADGLEGLRMALETHPDVILLDVVMPRMNGWDTLDKLRADAWGKEVRIIMLTVLDNTDHAAQGKDRGDYEYLLKTNFNLDEVVKKVQGK